MVGTTRKLVPRSKVKPADTWDLSTLYDSDADWERALGDYEARIPGYEGFRGRLGKSPEVLAACLQFDSDTDRLGERLGTYAFLKTAEDQTSGPYQEMLGRFQSLASKAGQSASFIQPEILAVPDKTLRGWMARPVLAPWKRVLEQVVRFKPHTLSDKEERLLAMQSEMAQATNQVFRQLTDADMKFGTIKDEQGRTIELSHGTYMTCLHSPDRKVRERAFRQYYEVFRSHAHTLAATLGGSVQRDVYYARARRYESALQAALFPDHVPAAVYDNLIAAVRHRLPAVHRYYDLRRRKMKLKRIHFFDTYVPILAERRVRHTWDQAVQKVLAALAPLGKSYTSALAAGLTGRWCDRFENAGKQSGAFSSGSYDSDPFILMNFQGDVLDHVFTLAHEAGHSMHSLLSSRTQPYPYYHYSILVAEVASTFNEDLLSRHLMAHARNKDERAYLINRQIDSVRGTIIRQTMFAEFERAIHAEVEGGGALTLDRFRQIYRDLLDAYFGPDFMLDDELSLECLRIPHFYRAFYVYKYATGMSAASALAERVVSGGKAELDAYLHFLSSGCSRDPLDVLRDAGVDMTEPHAVDQTLNRFEALVEELEDLL
jgi:oligoendopeptidase F